MEIQLNPSQQKIVELESGNSILVRGVAGSGKTTIGINRINYLSKFYCYEKDDNILFVTYNKTLISYVKTIYKNMNDDFSLFNQKKNVRIKTIDSLIYILYRYYESNKRKIIIKGSKRYEYVEKATQKAKKIYDKKIWKDIDNKFLLDEIDYINSNNISKLSTYQNLDRTGRFSSGKIAKRLDKNSEIREFIYRVCTEYINLLNKNNLTDFNLRARWVYCKLCKYVPQKFIHTHIIIDEAQDLTKVQLKIVQKLQRKRDYSSLMLISDTSQSIYSGSYLSYNSFKSIGFEIVGRSYILSKNYRTTCQIGNAAYSLIKNDKEIISNENYVRPSVLDRDGQYPLLKKFENQEEQFKYISILLAKKLASKHEMKEIAICTKQKNHLIELEKYLAEKGIETVIINDDKKKNSIETDCVKLVTFHSIKGLEFNVVILFNVNDKIIPYKRYETESEISIERRLLYVAMTRAKQRLYIFSWGDESEFLSDIDYKFIRTNEYDAFGEFYQIKTDDYRFLNKVSDINSYEEIVRQWFINELIDKLNYPLDMIDIEYEVKVFSKTGYVDVVCYHKVNGIKVPYVFCEIKRTDANLNQAYEQLKSYMSTNLDVQYGIISNGKNTQFFLRYDKRIIKINSLPEYKKNIIKKTDLYEMIKISSNESIFIEIDENNHANYFNCEKEKIYEDYGEVELGIYGHISAGTLKYAKEDIIGTFPVNEKVASNPNEYFILRIDGDSMINAGIEDGDYVLVRKQNHAKESDIVCCMVNDEATVKKISFRRNKILLIPENPKYHHIIVQESNFHINGVVLAVIKKKEGYYG